MQKTYINGSKASNAVWRTRSGIWLESSVQRIGKKWLCDWAVSWTQADYEQLMRQRAPNKQRIRLNASVGWLGRSESPGNKCSEAARRWRWTPYKQLPWDANSSHEQPMRQRATNKRGSRLNACVGRQECPEAHPETQMKSSIRSRLSQSSMPSSAKRLQELIA